MAESAIFSCDFCDSKSFSTKSNLKKHYDKFHGGVPESFHSLKTEKREGRPCHHCGSIFKQLPKHLAICKAKVETNTIAVSTIFQSRSRARRITEQDVGAVSMSEGGETDTEVVQGTPRKRSVSDRFDLKNDFDKWMIAKNITHITRQKYISALSKFLGTINIRAVSAKVTNVSNYLKTLDTVGGRRTLFLGYLKLVEFLRIQMKLDITPFEWPTVSDYVELYLKSEERKDLYHNFTNISKAMELGWSPHQIHDFLMCEVLLCCKDGKGFLFNVTLADFLKVERPDGNGFWEYNGPSFKVRFPDYLRQMLKSYAFIVRPRLLKGRKSHEVKLFELYERVGIPCPKSGSLFKYVEDFSKSLVQIKYESINETKYKFTWFKWADFQGEIKGYAGKSSEPLFLESDEEGKECDSQEAIDEVVQMETDYSIPQGNYALSHQREVEVQSPKTPSPKPSTSIEKRKRSFSSLNFSKEEIQFLKSFFKKYKASDLNDQTVMVVLQFEDDVEDLIESKMAASGMRAKQFWQALTSVLQENL